MCFFDDTWGSHTNHFPQQEHTRPSWGRRPNGFVKLSLNDRTIPFLVILLDKAVSVGKDRLCITTIAYLQQTQLNWFELDYDLSRSLSLTSWTNPVFKIEDCLANYVSNRGWITRITHLYIIYFINVFYSCTYFAVQPLSMEFKYIPKRLFIKRLCEIHF